MRIRTIKPEFWRSQDIGALPYFERLLFIGLWSYVDDNGVGIDDATRITADLFAGDLIAEGKGVMLRVADGLERLRMQGQIERYSVEGKRYLYVVAFHRHQRINRPSRARYPRPDQLFELAEDGGLSEPSVSPPAKAPIGTGEQGKGNTHMLIADAMSESTNGTNGAFEAFWKAYPRHVGKPEAIKAFARAVKRERVLSIISGVRRFAADPNLPPKQFIPYPATWLNRDGWADDALPERQDSRRPGDQPSDPEGWRYQ